ncbi:MAG: coenzyme F420-0:L-glutamate ligase [Bacilli bacterium]|jgi:F420-0:gamma-glutamyl ligase|nr:coenzyme F420-0:L-glutamate ligase [Bacilli bacterium]
MKRRVGTIVRGIRTPIIKQGDNLADIVVSSVLEAAKEENFLLGNRDVIAITESVVGMADGDYVTVDDIANDIKKKFPDGEIGVVFPILSRNRFALCLKGMARGTKKIFMLLSYPADEVGNHLFTEDDLDKHHINPWSDIISEEKYDQLFGQNTHIFTGINYVDLYRSIIEAENCQVTFIFANNPRVILDYTKNIIVSSIHSRQRIKRILKGNNANNVYGLDDILNKPTKKHAYNCDYGLLGSNKATEEKLKLFPTNGNKLVHTVQKKIHEITGKKVEVMVYGDGAFKDPVGGIWELADPVVSPAYTSGLEGVPNEIKLKYMADNKYANLTGEQLQQAIKKEIITKESNLKGQMETQGTTPRRLTDLIGSLCDLTSGSGDKGTPVVLVQGYFDNYADETS